MQDTEDDVSANEDALHKSDGGSLPYLALIGVQLLFGSLPAVGKVVLATIPPVALVGSRVGITALILFIFQWFRKRIWLAHRGDYLRLAVLSIFGIVFNQLLYVSGLSLTTAANTSVLAVTIPVFAIAAGSFLKIEILNSKRLAGIVLAAVGVIILIDPRKASFSSETTIGDIMIILNSLSYGIYVATSKEIITRNGAFRSMMWVFIFASIVCVPLGIYSFSTIDLAAVSTGIWLLALYVSTIATAGPYLLNAYALQKVSASTVAVFIYLQPVIGILTAAVFLGEVIGVMFLIASTLIFAGLYFTSRK